MVTMDSRTVARVDLETANLKTGSGKATQSAELAGARLNLTSAGLEYKFSLPPGVNNKNTYTLVTSADQNAIIEAVNQRLNEALGEARAAEHRSASNNGLCDIIRNMFDYGFLQLTSAERHLAQDNPEQYARTVNAKISEEAEQLARRTVTLNIQVDSKQLTVSSTQPGRFNDFQRLLDKVRNPTEEDILNPSTKTFGRGLMLIDSYFPDEVSATYNPKDDTTTLRFVRNLIPKD